MTTAAERENAIARASHIAYEKDRFQAIGIVADEYVVCDWEDEGRLAEMTNVEKVGSSGVV